jgi:hypothetical protein
MVHLVLPLPTPTVTTGTDGWGVEFQVQQSSGANAEEGKSWKCPVCQIDIEQGLAHTVAWDLHRGVETRRHFHKHCWKLFDGMLT